MNKRKSQARAAWMAAYEDEVTTLDPTQTGKLCWDTATYFFNQGMSPKDAANKNVGVRNNNSASR